MSIYMDSDSIHRRLRKLSILLETCQDELATLTNELSDVSIEKNQPSSLTQQFMALSPSDPSPNPREGSVILDPLHRLSEKSKRSTMERRSVSNPPLLRHHLKENLRGQYNGQRCSGARLGEEGSRVA